MAASLASSTIRRSNAVKRDSGISPSPYSQKQRLLDEDDAVSSSGSVRSVESFAERMARRKASEGRKPAQHVEKETLEELKGAVEKFPEVVLAIDTPCIVSIREATRTSQRQGTQTPHEAETELSIPKLRRKHKLASLRSKYSAQSQRGAIDRARLDGLTREYQAVQALEPYGTGSPTFDILSDFLDSPPILQAGIADPFTAQGVKEKTALPLPSLRGVRNIFPGSTPRWCETLYVYLLAYNYLAELLSSLPTQSATAGGVRAEVESLLGGLDLVLGRLIRYLAGDGLALVSQDGDGEKGRKETAAALVRALAEVVSAEEARCLA
jgi:hypothetical protein